MCGITGYYNFKKKVNENIIYDPLEKLKKRGPDNKDIFLHNNIVLGHTRLSIIDTSSIANQPMIGGANDNFTIVFNGEIYNYKSLQNQLIKEGFKFKTNSDTEVLIFLYQKYGHKMLKKLNGMFSLCIYDKQNDQLFLARDPLGIKPLYYYSDKSFFCFSSQIKSISEYKGVNNKINKKAEAGLYLFGSVPDPLTPFSHIKSLKAGSYMLVNKNNLEIKSFMKLESFLNIYKKNNVVTQEQIFDSLISTIKLHFISDVPVGVFLSSGVDSSIISNLSKYLNKINLKAFNISFGDLNQKIHDESKVAKKVAKLNDQVFFTQKINYNDFSNSFDKIFEAMDSPSIDGVNTFFVSRLAKNKNTKVVLSGAGADELFFGYSHFKRIPYFLKIRNSIFKYFFDLVYYLLRIPFYKSRIINLLKPGISLFETYLLFRGITTVSELRKKFGTELIDEFLHEINFQYYNSLSANNNEEIKGILRFFEYEFYLKNQLLKDADWASMYHSIELRVPFVNMNFIKEISSLNLNDNSDKKDLVNSVNQFYPLLEEVYNKNKKSFTTPLKLWFSKKFSYKNKTDNKILLNIIYEKYLNSFDKNKL